jgi:hypothetical protein
VGLIEGMARKSIRAEMEPTAASRVAGALCVEIWKSMQRLGATIQQGDTK